MLATAVDRLPPDLVVVAAAGNHGEVADPETLEGEIPRINQALKAGWSAALDDVIAVGAVTKEDRLASFCPDAPWIDVLAVGNGLVSTYLSRARPDRGQDPRDLGGWAQWSGTSFAAALVSGAVAASTDPGRYPARSAVRDILTSLNRSGEKTIEHTGARILRVHTS